MTISPEAELETRLTALLAKSFPHLKPSDFRNQMRFTLKLGHTNHEYDAVAQWQAEGRADIVMFHRERPLAVIEVKREDKTLSDKDIDQARSYGSRLTPPPPLTIVTNGKETWIRDGSTGKEIPEGIESAEAVEHMFANAAKIAASNMDWAIEVLMGPEVDIWTTVVRDCSAALIARMTGTVDEPRRPFSKDYLFPRRATAILADHLERGAQAIVLSGAPISGKSSVLREFCETTKGSPSWAVLMVAGQKKGPGLFQRLANLLSAAVDWKVEANDIRMWLRRMSRSSRGPALVLAIDGLFMDSKDASDVEELVEGGFGPALRVVLTTDGDGSDFLTASGRGETALGSVAKTIKLGSLDDEEFDSARKVLAARHIFFYGGAELSDEYRKPWTLRAALAPVPTKRHAKTAAFLPATMGMEVVASARQRLNLLHQEVRRNYRLLARDALRDEALLSSELALAQANAFVVRQDALSDKGDQALRDLAAEGWARSYRHASGEDVVSPQMPEFFMSELAEEMSRELEVRANADAEGAGAWLVARCERLFLGDLIGAQAMVDFGQRSGSLPLKLIEYLGNVQPVAEEVGPGLFAFQKGDGSVQNFRIDEEGRFVLTDLNGVPTAEPVKFSDGEGPGTTYASTMAWLILSQFARVRTAAGTDITHRIDIQIMLLVSKCRFPLLRGSALPKGHLVDKFGSHGEVLSDDNGLAEPITAAIFRLFATEWKDLDFFFEELVANNSLPQSIRVDLSPVRYPVGSRIRSSFGPVRSGVATGRGAKPSGERSASACCGTEALRAA